MAPHTERISELECHPHDPDAAQQMVCMSMGDEEVADLLTTNSSLFELGKDTIATSCVNKQHAFLAMKGEASIVASGGQGIACSQHGDIVVIYAHILIDYKPFYL